MGQFVMDMRTLDVLATVICFLYAFGAFFSVRTKGSLKVLIGWRLHS